MNTPEAGKVYSLFGISQGKTWEESEVPKCPNCPRLARNTHSGCDSDLYCSDVCYETVRESADEIAERHEELRDEVEEASDNLDEHDSLIDDKKSQIEELRGELEDMEDERIHFQNALSDARRELDEFENEFI
jgi:septal ring factor EnvC (AmiA/AmiB activator)